MTCFALVNSVAHMSETDREPGALIVAVAALSGIVVTFRCVTRFAVIQPDMIKIVFKPAIRVRVTGVARTQIMFSRSGVAVFAISVACVVELEFLPFFGIRMAADTGALGVMVFRFLCLVAG